MIPAFQPMIDPGIPWYYVAAMIVTGGAITTWGFHGMAVEWVKRWGMPTRVIPMMDLGSLLVCIFAGGTVGHYVLATGLGSTFGLAGGLGYKLFMQILKAFLSKKGWLNGDEPPNTKIQEGG